MGFDSCGVNLGQDFHVGSPFCSCQLFIRAIFLRALLCMVLMWGDQVSFLASLLVHWGVLLVDFLSIDLQDELLSWETGRSRWLQSCFC